MAGVSGGSSSSLEGVKVSRSYYSRQPTQAGQLTGLTPLAAARRVRLAIHGAGEFSWESDYTANTAVVDFTISPAAPTVTVSGRGRDLQWYVFPGDCQPSRGCTGLAAPAFEGIARSLAYYSGTYTSPVSLLAYAACRRTDECRRIHCAGQLRGERGLCQRLRTDQPFTSSRPPRGQRRRRRRGL